MPNLMKQTMRWFGPADPVSLADIRQAGCTGVVTALHEVPVGETWQLKDIEARKALVSRAGLQWAVIESLPVSEDIKRQRGDYTRHIEQYGQSLANIAAAGLRVVTYNFMPVLDWLRTDLSYPLPGGARALRFERDAFIAFDLFLLKRPGAENDYTSAEIKKARVKFDAMSIEEKGQLFRNLLLALPGNEEAFTPAQVLSALQGYSGIDARALRRHLRHFLHQVVPLAEALGLQLAIHPDDPPFPVLGLPRIASTEADLAGILGEPDSPANGLCFCTGSLGARPDNDLVKMIRRFGDRVHFLHLRNTRRDSEGNFLEAAHLEGDADMYAIVKEVLAIQQRRNIAIPMRPDHGHQMLDDLQKTSYPGYSGIGRLKALAELRGLERAVHRNHFHARGEQ